VAGDWTKIPLQTFVGEGVKAVGAEDARPKHESEINAAQCSSSFLTAGISGVPGTPRPCFLTRGR